MNPNKQTTKPSIFSILAPFFNEEEVAHKFYLRLRKVLHGYDSSEIIFVNDGSSDSTQQILNKIADEDYRVKVIELKKNRGQTEAILTGLTHAKGQAAIVLDSDLQDPPELIPKMIQAWERGAKIVLPRRISRQDSLFKKLTARFFYALLSRLSKERYSADFGEFYLIDREIVSCVLRHRKKKPLIRALLPHLHFPIEVVNYRRAGRKHGRSGYSIYKMLVLGWQGIRFAQKIDSEKALPKSVAIIGGGVGGLSLAYFLSKSKRFKVTVFEKERELGGLLQTASIEGRSIEKFYHHFFTSDKYLLDLLKELRLGKQIRWLKSSVGCLKEGQFSGFGSVADIWRLPFLSYVAKTRLLFGLLVVKLWPNFLLPAHWTSEKLARLLFSGACYEKIWQPMIKGKFNSYSKNISAKWLLFRLQIRTNSRSISGEKLGYLRGSLRILIDKLAREIVKSGGEIRTGAKVNDLTNQFNKALINGKDYFDYAVATAAGLGGKTVPHLGCICAIITLKNQLTPYYWTNVLDKDLPFKVIVEQINLVGSSIYNKHSVVYLSQYIEQNSKLFKSTDREIKQIYLEGLRKIFPKIKSEIVDMKIFRSAYAQPIIPAKYRRPPDKKGNIYYMTMSHIFPQDRGVNFAIRSAKTLAKELIQKH